MNHKISFLALIKKFKIEIPIIQRDYAQGRDNSKISEIRNTFINDIFESVVKKREPIDFDFIYGYIKKNTLNANVFIPLDGQQRITTLFLLYIFISNKENKIDEARDYLLNFSYKTRYTSRDFCIELVKNGIAFNDYPTNEKLSNIILDSSWFFLSWKNDPTIKSMLVMLDVIQSKFSINTNIYDILIDEEHAPFIFQYIELKDFGLTDDLYIKMNARGKILTDFENFKARFEQHIEKEHNEYLPAFNNNIDNSWTDFFWEFRDSKNTIDSQYYNFFKNIALNNYASKFNQNTKFYEFEDNLKILSNNENISFITYKKLDCFDEKIVYNIIKILNTIKANDKQFVSLINEKIYSDTELFKTMFSGILPRIERLYFYAYAMYICENDTLEGFDDWMRIIRNLIESTFYNNDDDYRKSILSIKKMLPFSNNILHYFTENEVDGFLKEQIDEEAIKAKLILINRDWETQIKEIENQGYFKGQISFLLKFSGIKELHDNAGKEFINNLTDDYFQSFINYKTKTELLFNKDGLKNFKNNLFERALLTFGNYTIQKGSNRSFLKNDDRDISWRRFLRNDFLNDFLKQLMDNITIENLETDFKNIITAFKDETSWRYSFIKHSELINCCGKNRFIRWNYDGKYILLLETKATFGYHYEYYSRALQCKLEKSYKAEVEYIWDKSVELPKYISIINNNKIAISFDYYKDEWQYLVEFKRTKNYFRKEKEVINYLKENSII